MVGEQRSAEPAVAAAAGSRGSRGITLIELLVVVAIVGVLSSVAVAAVQSAMRKAAVNAVAAECRELYTAFTRFNLDNNMFPYARSSPSLELDTFEPLRSAGYYRGNLSSRLVNGRADAYDSPDDLGTNGEFWLTLTVAADPRVRFLVCHSDDTPFAGGQWMEGIYVYQDGRLIPIEKYKA